MKRRRISAGLCTVLQVHPITLIDINHGKSLGPFRSRSITSIGSISLINCLHLYYSAGGDSLQLFLE
jgi:hypothetical protein